MFITTILKINISLKKMKVRLQLHPGTCCAILFFFHLVVELFFAVYILRVLDGKYLESANFKITEYAMHNILSGLHE